MNYNMEKLFDLIDYKGKYYIIQDEDCLDEDWEYSEGKITKEMAMNKEFAENHIKNCEYYGIPPYFGNDEDLIKIYR